MVSSILVVDDDPHIRDVICFALEKAGMATEAAVNGVDALDRFERNEPSLVILDIGMPEMDGLEVCRRLRKTSEVPILFLSARDEEIDRVLGLEIGGDDYVTKPFSPRELVARINVILRRTKKAVTRATEDAALFVRAGFAIDTNGHTAAFHGQDLALTAREFAIMGTLAARPNVVFGRDRLMEAAYAANIHVSDRTIDSHVRNIRAKFASAGCNSAIETVHGVGFRLGRCEPDR
ncbi:MAG: response regulator transcription factor [Hyphomicrobiales bacterium]|nr:response regulator transcription factor [Hyphomicrobiales bacterium]